MHITVYRQPNFDMLNYTSYLGQVQCSVPSYNHKRHIAVHLLTSHIEDTRFTDPEEQLIIELGDTIEYLHEFKAP